MSEKSRSVSFYTLGCKVNQYETQMLKERFEQAGFTVLGEEEFADVYVINTCSVTNMSDRKSRQHIRRLRGINPDALIAVTGCYAQTAPEDVASVEGVSLVVGTNEKNNLVKYVSECMAARAAAGMESIGAEASPVAGGIEKGSPENAMPVYTYVKSYEELDEYIETGLITSMDSRTRAFIKVQEGCDRFCSYCIIPYARGKVRSRQLKDVRLEAEKLIGAGFKELVLTGINTALYGVDFDDNEGMSGIERLIAEVDSIPGDFRIRLSSLEPNVVDVETAAAVTKYKKLCPHMHLSIQSGSDSVLKRMKRRYDTARYLEIAEELRKSDPDYGITTDIIVGFPGETEDEFAETLDMVKRAGFSRVHAFRYSKRSGTVAAKMADQVDGKTSAERVTRLIEEADKVAEAFCQRSIGRTRRVLFEVINDEGELEGYTDNYIRVYVRPEEGASESLLDTFADVKLERLYKDGIKGSLI